MLATKRNDQLLVGLLLAVLVQHAHVRLATVEGLGSLTQTAGEAVVDEGDLEDTLEGVDDGHLGVAGGAAGGEFDFGCLLRCDGAGGLLFSVRLGGGDVSEDLHIFAR